MMSSIGSSDLKSIWHWDLVFVGVGLFYVWPNLGYVKLNCGWVVFRQLFYTLISKFARNWYNDILGSKHVYLINPHNQLPLPWLARIFYLTNNVEDKNNPNWGRRYYLLAWNKGRQGGPSLPPLHHFFSRTWPTPLLLILKIALNKPKSDCNGGLG